MISKHQEIIGQDLGMKSAHGTNSDSTVMPHIDMKTKWIDDSQGVALDELNRTRQEVEDVDDAQNIEMIAVKVVQEFRLFWVEWLAEHRQ